jgi:hypothetical protein
MHVPRVANGYLPAIDMLSHGPRRCNRGAHFYPLQIDPAGMICSRAFQKTSHGPRKTSPESSTTEIADVRLAQAQAATGATRDGGR